MLLPYLAHLLAHHAFPIVVTQISVVKPTLSNNNSSTFIYILPRNNYGASKTYTWYILRGIRDSFFQITAHR